MQRDFKPGVVVFAVLIAINIILTNSISGPTPAQTAQESAPAVTDGALFAAPDADPRNEPSISVSRTNPQVLVGASKWIDGGASGSGNTRVQYYYSSNGGQTWGTAAIPLETPQKTWGRMSDPSVACDLDGNFYLCVLALGNVDRDSGVYIFKSTDNGQTFINPVPVVLDIGSGNFPKLADKCYITVDTQPGSPFKNTIYAAWVSVEPTRLVILTNHRRPGEAAFSTPVTISHSGDMRGPSIATGPGGELYVAWEGIGGPKVILFNASTDGGTTFLPPEAAHPDFRLYAFVGSLSSPNPSLIIRPVSRINSFPVMDVDRSNGPNRGTLYVAFAETKNGVDADVYVLKVSPPAGGMPTVSLPIRVNDDPPGADQFFPWLSVDPANGDIEVAFYDRRNDPAGNSIDVYFARSTNGAASFDGNIRLSSASSNALTQAQVTGGNGSPIGIGDYISLQAINGKAYAMWTDSRRGVQEIFRGNVVFNSPGGGGGGGGGAGSDACQNPRPIASLPFQDTVDTSAATSAADDPVTCAASQGSNSIWYSLTAPANTWIGVDSSESNYDTVLSVYSGACGALNPVACNDDFAGAANNPNRAVLVFQAALGATYLIEATGKGAGGSLRLKIGFPVITGIEYPSLPKGSELFRITGAGFRENDVAVSMNRAGDVFPLPNIAFTGQRQADGTFNEITATRKKLRKVVQPGTSVTVTLQSPASGGAESNPVVFTRPQ